MEITFLNFLFMFFSFNCGLLIGIAVYFMQRKCFPKRSYTSFIKLCLLLLLVAGLLDVVLGNYWLLIQRVCIAAGIAAMPFLIDQLFGVIIRREMKKDGELNGDA